MKRHVGIVPTSQSSKIHYLSSPVCNTPGITNIAYHTNRSNICLEKVELESLKLEDEEVEYVKGSVGKVKKVLEKVKKEGGWGETDLYGLEAKLIGDNSTCLGTQSQVVDSRIAALREANVDCNSFSKQFCC